MQSTNLTKSAVPPLGSADVLGEEPPDDVVVVAGPRLATLGLFEPPQPAATTASIAATTPNKRCRLIIIRAAHTEADRSKTALNK
jgi:hypothetical protein